MMKYNFFNKWYSDFLGIIGLPNFYNMRIGNDFSYLNLLWLLWFLNFLNIIDKKENEQ